ncbi:glycosyltransferase family 9 protein [Streptomyces sp. M19]
MAEHPDGLSEEVPEDPFADTPTSWTGSPPAPTRSRSRCAPTAPPPRSGSRSTAATSSSGSPAPTAARNSAWRWPRRTASCPGGLHRRDRGDPARRAAGAGLRTADLCRHRRPRHPHRSGQPGTPPGVTAVDGCASWPAWWNRAWATWYSATSRSPSSAGPSRRPDSPWSPAVRSRRGTRSSSGGTATRRTCWRARTPATRTGAGGHGSTGTWPRSARGVPRRPGQRRAGRAGGQTRRDPGPPRARRPRHGSRRPHPPAPAPAAAAGQGRPVRPRPGAGLGARPGRPAPAGRRGAAAAQDRRAGARPARRRTAARRAPGGSRTGTAAGRPPVTPSCAAARWSGTAPCAVCWAPVRTARTCALAAAVTAGRPEAVVRVITGNSLNQTANLLAETDLLVGNDSALAHVAAAVRTPTVVLYGPTGTEFLWARVYPHHHGCRCATLPVGRQPARRTRGPELRVRLPGPYSSAAGPYPRCLSDIGVDQVWAVVARLLGTAAAPSGPREARACGAH